MMLNTMLLPAALSGLNTKEAQSVLTVHVSGADRQTVSDAWDQMRGVVAFTLRYEDDPYTEHDHGCTCR